MTRRILFAAAAALCVLYIGLSTVSFFKNRSLMSDAKEAAQILRPIPPPSGQILSLETLQKLDKLREPADAVSKYDREGAPWSYRWGLYPGRPEYENIRALYCEQLRRHVLSDTQASMLRLLRSVPGIPGPDDNYDIPYSTLKAHLISTSKYHQYGKEESEVSFMTNTLAERWAAGRPTAPDQYGKARDQFRFYAEERFTDFCPVTADQDAIDRSRAYLCQFKLVDRAYRNMIDEVSRKRPPLKFFDPAGTVVDPQEVRFAYSREGYAMMQAAIQKAPDYINREQWVLGDRCTNASMDPALLKAQLQARYEADFISQWMTFLNRGRVTPYANFKDAAAKLTVHSNPAAPPLLQLFCMISENTAVDNAAIKSQFQSFQNMSPPATCHAAPNGPPTQEYMVGLGNLRLGVDRIANSNNPASENLTESGPAKSAAVGTEQKNLLIPKAGSLLEDPIVYAENLIRNLGPDEVNKKGGGTGFCGDPLVKGMFSKYPFNKSSSQDVRPEELSYFFAPNTGKIWQFYNETLQEFIAPTGGGYGEKTGAKFKPTDQFLHFFNQSAKLSRTLYMTNPTAAHAAFSLQGQPSPEFENYTLQIGGQSLKGKESGSPKVDFTWPDSGTGASLRYKPRDEKENSTDNYTGAWAAVRLFDLADRTPATGGSGTIEYVLELQSSSRFGKQQTGSQTKRTATLRFTYEGKGAPGTILPSDLHFQCVPAVVKK
jgi:type VI secretion system protein ImpL